MMIPDIKKQATTPKGIISKTLLLSRNKSESNPSKIPPKNTPRSNNITITLD